MVEVKANPELTPIYRMVRVERHANKRTQFAANFI